MPYKYFVLALTFAIAFISFFGCGYIGTSRNVAPTATTIPLFHNDANATNLERNQLLPSELLQTLFGGEEHKFRGDIDIIDYTTDGIVFAWIPEERGFSLESSKSLKATKYSTKLSLQLDEIPNSNVELNCEIWFLDNRGFIGSVVLDEFTLPEKLKIGETMPNAVFFGGSDKDTFVEKLNLTFTFIITGDNFEKHLGGLYTIPLESIWNDIRVSTDELELDQKEL